MATLLLVGRAVAKPVMLWGAQISSCFWVRFRAGLGTEGFLHGEFDSWLLWDRGAAIFQNCSVAPVVLQCVLKNVFVIAQTALCCISCIIYIYFFPTIKRFLHPLQFHMTRMFLLCGVSHFYGMKRLGKFNMFLKV